MKFNPHGYQERAIKFGIERACAGFFLEPGMGKTSIMFAIMVMLKKLKLIDKILVLAPLRVVYSTWPAERTKWDDFAHLSIGILHGPDKDKVLAEKHDIYLMNYEGLKWLFLATKRNWPFDMLIIDESTKLKATNTQRFKTLKQMLGKFKRRYILTGSPAPNSLMDVFGQVYCMDQGATFGPYVTVFKDKYFIQTGFGGYEWVLKPGADIMIHQELGPKVLRLDAKDYLELPELIETDIKVDLPKEAMAQYLSMEKKLRLDIENNQVTAANAAVASMKCIAEGTEVLTDLGWVPIEKFTTNMRVWDGIEWVNADKLQYNGYTDVINCFGVLRTSTHKELPTQNWKTASEIINAKASSKYERLDFWLPDGTKASAKYKTQPQLKASLLGSAVRVWENICMQRGMVTRCPQTKRKELRLQERHTTCISTQNTRYVKHSAMGNLAQYAVTLSRPIKQRLSKLRGPRDYSCRQMANFCRFLGGYVVDVYSRLNTRAQGCQWQVLQKQLLLGNAQSASTKYAEYAVYSDRKRPIKYFASSGALWPKVYHFICTLKKRLYSSTSLKMNVYDIINAGPRHRFTVRSHDGAPLLVHNCRQLANGAIYTDIGNEFQVVHDTKIEALQDLLEELSGQPALIAYDFEHDLIRLKAALGKDTPHIGSGVSPKRAKEIVDAWNRGEIPYLLGQPMSMAHGLNMQEKGRAVIWFGLTWSLENREQFIRRVWRQGVGSSVFVYNIIARNTIDEAVMLAVAAKDKEQQALLNALRNYWASK